MKNLLIGIKVAGVLLLIYVHLGGLLFEVPRLEILHETVRALYFHVPMWFGMMLLFLVSVINAIAYLDTSKNRFDEQALVYAKVGTAFGILGVLSGMLWANYTWGSPWHGDVKQNMAAICLLIYAAYFVLRNSLPNHEQRGRLSAVYNIFAFAAMIPLLFIIPRMYSSMHPGNGGNPGFNVYDLDSRMRLVFYPAIVGWFFIGVWIASLQLRISRVQEHLNELEDDKTL